MKVTIHCTSKGENIYKKSCKIVFFRNAKSNDGVFSFDYIGEFITNFEMPISNVYKIEAWGASGGSQNAAPPGAYSKSFVTLNKGEVVQILVGEKGYDGYSGGGDGNCIYCSKRRRWWFICSKRRNSTLRCRRWWREWLHIS
jgi:hypothetical protein